MYNLGLVDPLVTHANTKGFGLISLSGVRRVFMPPQLKGAITKKPKRTWKYLIGLLQLLLSRGPTIKPFVRVFWGFFGPPTLFMDTGASEGLKFRVCQLGSAIKNLGLYSKSPGDFKMETMDF